MATQIPLTKDKFAIIDDEDAERVLAFKWSYCPAGTGYATRNAYLGGAGQTFGGARTTRVLGINVQEVPYYPADYADLTFPQNRVWGFQRDITVNREYKPKKDTIEYTIFVRFGITWEELDAVAYIDASGVVSS